jgi:cell division protein YceG involved in septum cleavage
LRYSEAAAVVEQEIQRVQEETVVAGVVVHQLQEQELLVRQILVVVAAVH